MTLDHPFAPFVRIPGRADGQEGAQALASEMGSARERERMELGA